MLSLNYNIQLCFNLFDKVILSFFLSSFFFFSSYLVMPFMGTDLSKIMKHEKLTEDRIQFLVYQMLKGLKVCRFYYCFDFTIVFPSKPLWKAIHTYHLIAE